MEITVENLKSRYSEMDDGQLVELETRGGLTDVAAKLVADEISQRGIDRDVLAEIEDASPNKALRDEPWRAEHPREAYWEQLLFGRVSLSITFWGFWLFGKLAVVGIVTTIVEITAIAPFFVVAFLFEVFVFIALFNSARAYNKHSEKPWGALALMVPCAEIVTPIVFILLAMGHSLIN